MLRRILRFRLREAAGVMIRRTTPDHFTSAFMRPLSHRAASWFVTQRGADFAGDHSAVTERNKYTATVGEQFSRVPVRRGDHRFARAKGIGQCARHNLL